MSFVPLVRLWLVLSVLASLAGWGLSAVGQLNRPGYVVFGVLAAAVGWAGRGPLGLRPEGVPHWRRWLGRCRRGWGLAFVVLCGLVLAGGALYPPSNHTAFTYRIPRVLHWLAEGRWHWIHTGDYRLNNRACGIEWFTAPLLLFTRSDRTLFLLNFVPYLLLPGLCFSVFRRLGVRPRVAWYWMWLLPGSYTFILQAGSAGNDTFPAVYALAALDFALRAWTSRRVADLGYSCVAAALLTGAKASNLPLLLPWALALLPVLGVFLRRPLVTAGVALVCAGVSFLPTAALNIRYCTTWSGLNLERAGMDLKQPLVGLWGNAFFMTLNNFVPPIFPAAGWWNQSGLGLLPKPMAQALLANFENGSEQLKELQTEDWAGLGFGVSVLVVISFFAALELRSNGAGAVPSPAGQRGGISLRGVKTLAGSSPPPQAAATRTASPRPALAETPRILFPDRLPLLRWAILLGSWVALLAFCLKSGMSNGARLVSPYYPLLLPLLILGPGHEVLVRRGWWRALGAAVTALAALVLIVTPGRPLWPAETILSRAALAHPERGLYARALRVYTVYADRYDPTARVRSLVPPGETEVGFLADPDDIDISFWRPYFSRRVRHLLLEDSAAEIRKFPIHYVAVGGAFLEVRQTTIAEWCQKVGAEVVGSTAATLKVAQGPMQWYVVRLKDN